MKKNIGIIVLVVSCMLLINQHVWGSVGSIINVGAMNSGVSHDTGTRESIELTRKDEMLIGWTKHKNIKLVTVFAPGSGKGHVILREITLADGKKSFYLSAPDSLIKKVKRATIYFKHQADESVLYEYIRGEWKERKPTLISISNKDNEKHNREYLLAFSVEQLGLYWLSEGNAVNTASLHYPSANMLFGGSIYRGLLSWTWAIIFLVIGAIISFLAHKINRYRI